MSAKATPGKPGSKSSSKTSKQKAEPRQRAIEAAMALAAKGDWSDVSLGDVAEEAGLSLAELYDIFPSKLSIMAGIGCDVDQAVLEAGPPEGDTVRDKLFEMLMRRFDVLEPDRSAMRSMIRGTVSDPLALVCLGPRFAQSMAWMLEACDIASDGPRGSFCIKGLGAIQLATLKIWLDDDSEDLAKTMSALDKNLSRAEWIMGLCRYLPGPRSKASADESTLSSMEPNATS